MGRSSQPTTNSSPPSLPPPSPPPPPPQTPRPPRWPAPRRHFHPRARKSVSSSCTCALRGWCLRRPRDCRRHTHDVAAARGPRRARAYGCHYLAFAAMRRSSGEAGCQTAAVAWRAGHAGVTQRPAMTLHPPPATAIITHTTRPPSAPAAWLALDGADVGLTGMGPVRSGARGSPGPRGRDGPPHPKDFFFLKDTTRCTR